MFFVTIARYTVTNGKIDIVRLKVGLKFIGLVYLFHNECSVSN